MSYLHKSQEVREPFRQTSFEDDNLLKIHFGSFENVNLDLNIFLR